MYRCVWHVMLAFTILNASSDCHYAVIFETVSSMARDTYIHYKLTSTPMHIQAHSLKHIHILYSVCTNTQSIHIHMFTNKRTFPPVQQESRL